MTGGLLCQFESIFPKISWMWYELMKNLSLTFYLVAFIYVPFNLHLCQYPYLSPNLLSSNLKYDFTFEVNYGFRHSL